jgi:hypothetical protein
MQGQTAKTLALIGGQNDGCFDGPKMSRRPAAAPAPPIDLILPHLALFCLPGKVCKLLRGDLDFRRLEFRCHQFAEVKDIAESRYNRTTRAAAALVPELSSSLRDRREEHFLRP